MEIQHTQPGEGACPEAWARASSARPGRLLRRTDAPRPESVQEVALWAGSEGFRRTELIVAPVLWVVLPLIALGFLIQQSIADPTGAGWNASFFGETVEVWPTWFLWLVWIGVSLWLLITVGVLLLRLSIHRDLLSENLQTFEHGVAHEIHQASVSHDYGDGGSWPTYIALDHRLDDDAAARIHAAFEHWLSGHLPPSGSGPVSSETLFGTQASGGYFFLHLPVSQTAGEPTDHRWLLITEPRDSIGSNGELIVTPVPVGKRFLRMREKARRQVEKGRR